MTTMERKAMYRKHLSWDKFLLSDTEWKQIDEMIEQRYIEIEKKKKKCDYVMPKKDGANKRKSDVLINDLGEDKKPSKQNKKE